MDYGHLRFLTRNFYSLQGLRMVLIGACLLGWKLVEPAWPKSNLRDSCQLALMVAATAGWIMLGSCYRSRIGCVKLNVTLWGVASAPVFLIGWLYAGYLDVKSPPVSFASIVMACFFAAVAIGSRGRRWYYFVPAAAFLVLSVTPMAGILSARAVDGRPSSVTLGLAFVFTGMLDHFLLVRSLPVSADA